MKKFIFSLGVLAFSFAFATSVSATPLPDDLVGWWEFNETEGTTAYDSSANPEDGTVYGGVGMNGSFYMFDGVDDYVEVSHNDKLDMTTAYSLEVWVYVEDDLVNLYRPILFRGTVNSNDIEIYVQANSKNLIVAHNRGNGGTFDYVGFNNPPLNDWFHLAVVFNGTNVLAYYDGLLADVAQQDTAMTVPLDTDSGWWIGKVDHASFGTLLGGEDDNYFKRDIGDVKIWSKVLTVGELTDYDNDTVVNDIDLCPVGTEADEKWSGGWGTNRWQLGDGMKWYQNAPANKKNSNGPTDTGLTVKETYGCSCEQILDSMSKTLGANFGGHYKYGCSKSIIEDWISGKYYIGPTEVDEFDVSGTSNTVVQSNIDTKVDTKYFIEASGTYKFVNWVNAGIADASCSLRIPGSFNSSSSIAWISGSDLPSPYTNYLELWVNGAPFGWGDCNELDHTYTKEFIGNGSPLSFSILDNAYGDNEGSLQVKIIEDKWVDLW